MSNIIPKVVNHVFDPLTERHTFVMADGIVLQCSYDFMVAAGTKENFQAQMEQLYVKVRDANGGSAEPVPSGIPEAGPIGTGIDDGLEVQGGGIGATYGTGPPGPHPLHSASAGQS